MKKVFKLIGFISLIMIVLTASIYAGKSVDDLEKEIEANEEKQEKGKKEIEEIERRVKELNASIEKRNQQIIETGNKLDQLELDKIAKKEEIAQAEIDLAHAIEEEELYVEHVKERIKVMYEHGESSYIEVLLDSEDLGDFFSRLEYIQKILEYDDEMLAKLESIHENIENKRNQLEIDKEVLLDLIDDANATKKELEGYVQQLKIEIEQADNDKDVMLRQMEKWKEEEKELDKQMRDAVLAEKYVFKDGDTFAWPLDGYYYISSQFGPRTHPIHGYRHVHTGIDLPAPYGTPITAAATGKVIRANFSRGYGNVVVINHGNNLATLYAHNSSFAKGLKEGDIVLKGQVIAYIGSTGWSTGNHLHFGVKKNGKWVDPTDFYN